MAKEDGSKELSIKERFDQVCRELNMDETTANHAWETYERIKGNYSLEVCILHDIVASSNSRFIITLIMK